MGVTGLLLNSMELENLVKELKTEIGEKENVLKTFTDDMNKTYKVVEKIERSIGNRAEEYERNLSGKTLEINAKEREVEKLNQKLEMLKDDLNSVKSAKAEVEGNLKALENKLNAKSNDVDVLNKKLSSMKKKVEFKSSLEKSFESLQQQFQAKLEKLKKGGLRDYQEEIIFAKPSFKEIHTTRRGY